jgi:hypothetical protein
MIQKGARKRPFFYALCARGRARGESADTSLGRRHASIDQVDVLYAELVILLLCH